MYIEAVGRWYSVHGSLLTNIPDPAGLQYLVLGRLLTRLLVSFRIWCFCTSTVLHFLFLCLSFEQFLKFLNLIF